MKIREIASSPRWGFLLLFVVSLLIPLVHDFLIDAELEHHRYQWGLMPAELLFLRWFGQLSHWGPAVSAGLFALSWKYKVLNTPAAIARLASAFYLLTTLYAGYLCLLFWMYVQNR